MIVYAIRQKSTGYFIPTLKGRAGGSWLEPEPNCLPRLFTSKRNAKLALGSWLSGHFKMESFRSSYESFFDDDCELTVTPVPGRNKDDMEIVALELKERVDAN